MLTSSEQAHRKELTSVPTYKQQIILQIFLCLFDQRGLFRELVFVKFCSQLSLYESFHPLEMYRMPHSLQGWSEISKNGMYQQK